MAEQWWETADGLRDNEHRDRFRLLKALAESTAAFIAPAVSWDFW